MGLSMDPAFFTVTKAFHNALQGGHYELHETERNIYLKVNQQSAELLDTDYDVIVVHDPQPAALRHFVTVRGAKWIWRCHIDSSAPDLGVRDFLAPYVHEYDAFVFTMAQFVLPALDQTRVRLIAPAIDPFATKNMELSVDLCKRAIADSGVDATRPIMLQVSRFRSPWISRHSAGTPNPCRNGK
jgi:trehalose synthase